MWIVSKILLGVLAVPIVLFLFYVFNYVAASAWTNAILNNLKKSKDEKEKEE